MGCKSINLACNAIQEVPGALGGLVHLEELNLNDNSIKTLPVEFSQLVKLKKLFLGKNHLLNKREDVEPLMLLTGMTELKEVCGDPPP